MTSSYLPLAILLTSALTSPLIFCLREDDHRARTVLNLGAALFNFGLVVWLTIGLMSGGVFITHIPFLPGVDIVLHGDALSVLFAALSSLLWLVTTVFAIGYLEYKPHRSRFFGFFALCVSATMGVSLAGNLMTFLVFYEILTLATYPLVVHWGDARSVRGAKVYLRYTLFGGGLLLIGTAWLYAVVGTGDFIVGGLLSGMANEELAVDPAVLTAIAFFLIAGLGVKAALIPVHGWLPVAMVAPAPVSALLHAVAVVKAGAFGIVRVIYDVFGITLAAELHVTTGLAIVAAATIVYGSLCALRQDDLKRRLAFSTVSQVSYIALGTALASPIAAVGGIVHLIHQGMMKITLFFCAGILKETLGVDRISAMNGIGRRMPWTMAAFTIGALGMIGVPPTVGFVSKWYIGTGALDAEAFWVLLVLGASSLLNAAYFLPILNSAWFKSPNGSWYEKRSGDSAETGWFLLLPPLFTSMMVLLLAFGATEPWSPLGWTTQLALREFGFTEPMP